MWQKVGAGLLTAAAMLLVIGVTANTPAHAERQKTEQKPQIEKSSGTVKGTVVDEQGEPVIGVLVLIDKTNYTAITDINGTYAITYRNVADPILNAKFVGMETFVAPINGRTQVDFTMKEEATKVEAVQVVGYGTQRKASVVGAITTMNIDNIVVPVSNLSTQLAGQLAGVIGVTRSGEPGTGGDFYIRGIATFGANNKPLVLVDGIERELDLVDTEDIQTFSILKDASASAVYGVRGANGVVLITTKKGREGERAQISISGETGIIQTTRMPKFVNSPDFARAYNDATGKQYYSPDVIEMYENGTDPDLYPNVNWIDELFSPMAQNYKANLNVSGGGKVARYYIGGSFYNEGSIYKNDGSVPYKSAIDYNKFSFRANLDVNLFPQTVLNLNVSNVYTTRNAPATNDIGSYNAGRDQIWYYTFATSPNAFPMKYSDGHLSGPAGSGFNPYNLLTNSGYREDYWNSAQALVGLTQEFKGIVDGLRANVKFSWDSENTNSLVYQATPAIFNAYDRDEFGNLVLTQLNEGSNTLGYQQAAAGSRTTYFEASLSYDNAFGKHRVGALLLYNSKVRNVMMSGNQIGSLPYKNQGLAARLTYSFDDRYFIEGNVGYNGSENFAPGHRFGLFPAGAIGWILSNENFMEGSRDWLSLLKFKASYGLVGNDQIGGGRRFIYNETIITNRPGYDFGETPRGTGDGYAVGELANPNVGWEEAKKLNVGVELTLFDKLILQADYFAEDRSGIFMQRRSITDVAGVSTLPWVNIGRMKNKGVDASLEFRERAGEVFFTARGNFTYAHNEVIDRDEPTPLYPYLSEIGKPWGQQTGLIAEGFFENQEEINTSPNQFGVLKPGDIKYRDINGDGKVDQNDKVAIGYTNTPEIIYGFGGTIQWRFLDFGFFFQGAANVTRMTGGDALRPFSGSNLSRAAFFQDVYDGYWSPTRDNTYARYPRLTDGPNNNNGQSSTLWQQDMSFLRLKSVEIGFNLPKPWLNKMQLSNFRIYVAGVNLVTFSKFKLWDPEMDKDQGNGYPPSAIYNIGLKITY